MRIQSLYTFLILFFIGWQATGYAQTAKEQFVAGEKLYLEGDYEGAMKHFTRAIKKDEANPDYYKRRGDCKLRLTRPDGALRDYSKALDFGGNTAALHMSRGAAYQMISQHEASLKEFDLAIAKDSLNPIAHYNRATANYMLYKVKDAEKDFSAAIALNPEFAEAYYYRGVTRSEIHKGQGVDDIEKALKLDNQLIDAYFSLAVVLHDRGEYKTAVDYLNKHMEAIGDSNDKMLSQALFYRAECYYNLDKSTEACEDWKRSGDLGDAEAADFHFSFCVSGKEKRQSKKRGNREVISF